MHGIRKNGFPGYKLRPNGFFGLLFRLRHLFIRLRKLRKCRICFYQVAVQPRKNPLTVLYLFQLADFFRKRFFYRLIFRVVSLILQGINVFRKSIQNVFPLLLHRILYPLYSLGTLRKDILFHLRYTAVVLNKLGHFIKGNTVILQIPSRMASRRTGLACICIFRSCHACPRIIRIFRTCIRTFRSCRTRIRIFR